MLPHTRAAQQYLQTQVRSSTPLELVVLLYDGALRATATAAEAMARRDIPTRRVALSKAMGIISELQSTLDMDGGGDISIQLDRLYTWMTSQLIEATVKKDPKPIQDVHHTLEILQDAWRQIAVGKPLSESGVNYEELVELLEQYRAGIEAELALLEQLRHVAQHQREVTKNADFTSFTKVSDTRDDLMRGLVALEDNLRTVRHTLTAHRDLARTIPGYEEVAQRHLEAVALVNQILNTDQQSMSALADAELARRSAVVSLERGETTLAAYRRVLAPPLAHASLVNRLG